jgi:hypothetical protein
MEIAFVDAGKLVPLVDDELGDRITQIFLNTFLVAISHLQHCLRRHRRSGKTHW